MTPKSFRIALRSFARQRPFRPFLIEFSSGNHIRVPHPEAVSYHGSLLVFRSAEGVYALFECHEVTRVMGEENLELG